MIPLEALQNLVQPYLAEDPTLPLFVSVCCNRLYVGRVEPTACRTCPKVPSAVSVTSDSDLPEVLGKIQP